MKAGFSMKLILYFAPNCPQQIVAPNCPTPNCPRRIVRAELSCAELSAHRLSLFSDKLSVTDRVKMFDRITSKPGEKKMIGDATILKKESCLGDSAIQFKTDPPAMPDKR